MAVVRCQYGQKYHYCGDGGITVYLLEAYHQHLPLELPVHCRERVSHRVHHIDMAAQIGRCGVLYAVQQPRDDGRIQRAAETRANETYDTHRLEIIGKRNTARQSIRQRGVHDTYARPLEKHWQVEHVFLGRGVDQEIEQERHETDADNAFNTPLPLFQGHVKHTRPDSDSGSNRTGK